MPSFLRTLYLPLDGSTPPQQHSEWTFLVLHNICSLWPREQMLLNVSWNHCVLHRGHWIANKYSLLTKLCDLKTVVSKWFCQNCTIVLGHFLSWGVLLVYSCAVCSVQWKTHSMISLSNQVWCPIQYSLCVGWLKKDSYDNYISVKMVIFKLRI